jgi:hypothetical protein
MMQSSVPSFFEEGTGVDVRRSLRNRKKWMDALEDAGVEWELDCVSAHKSVCDCASVLVYALGFSPSIQHPAGDTEMLGRQRFISVRPLQYFIDDAVFKVG